MQENGRFGMSVLQRGLQLAGYSRDASLSGDFDAIDIVTSGIDVATRAAIVAVQSEQAFDCNGLDTAATFGLAVNVYRLDEPTRQLTCQGNQGGAPMAIVEGVEAFHVLYGIDSDGDVTTDEPQQYIPYAADINPDEVVALRFALLVNSGSPIRSRDISDSFIVLNEKYEYDDQWAREVFSSTVKLRNRR